MFERFTKEARQVVVHAQEEARALGHDHIGTEHLLLGLLHEQEGVAAQALARLDIELVRTRARVIEVVGEGHEARPGEMPFRPEAKKVLERALHTSLSLGQRCIDTEHILLGLARDRDSPAMRVLRDLGADEDRIRLRVGERLGGLDVRSVRRRGLIRRVRGRLGRRRAESSATRPDRTGG